MAEAGGAKSGQGGRGGAVPVRPGVGMQNARGGGKQRGLDNIIEHPWTPSKSLAGHTACSLGRQVDKNATGAKDHSKVSHLGAALNKWAKNKLAPRAGDFTALIDKARLQGAAEARAAQIESDKVLQEELDKELAELGALENDVEEGDKKKIRQLTSEVEKLTIELLRRGGVEDDSQPASSSSDAQLTAAVAQLEGALQTIKALKVQVKAMKAAKLLVFYQQREEAQVTADSLGRIEEDIKANRLRALAVASQPSPVSSASPESSVSPQSVADSNSPDIHVVRFSHLNPETRNPKPPKPETRNLKPETRNPKSETRNPKPETRLPPGSPWGHRQHLPTSTE